MEAWVRGHYGHNKEISHYSQQIHNGEDSEEEEAELPSLREPQEDEACHLGMISRIHLLGLSWSVNLLRKMDIFIMGPTNFSAIISSALSGEFSPVSFILR